MSNSKIQSLSNNPSNSDTKYIKKALLHWAKPNKFLLFGGYCAVMVNAGTNLAFPMIIGSTFDNSSTSSWSEEKLISSSFALFLGTIASWVRVYCFRSAYENISSRVKQLLFDSFVDQDIDFFSEYNTGDLLTVLDGDVKEVATMWTDKFPDFLRGCSSTILGGFFLVRISPKLVLLSGICVPAIAFGAYVIEKFTSKYTEALRKTENEVITYVTERIHNMSTIHLNGRKNYEKNTFCNYTTHNVSLSHPLNCWSGAYIAYFNLSMNLSTILVLYSGGKMVSNKEITTGELITFILRSGFVGLGIKGIMTSLSEIKKCYAATERYSTV